MDPPRHIMEFPTGKRKSSKFMRKSVGGLKAWTHVCCFYPPKKRDVSKKNNSQIKLTWLTMENHHGFIGNTNLHSWLWNWPAIVMLVFWRVTFNSNQNHGHMVDGPKSSVICSDASKKGLENSTKALFMNHRFKVRLSQFHRLRKSQKPNPPR